MECVRQILLKFLTISGPGSSVGIATGYGLDGLGIESRWGRDFPHLSKPALGAPPNLLYNGYRIFLGSKERPGRDADPSSPSSAVGNERVELYLYSPYGPYGLYRTSVPVQGCTLLLLYMFRTVFPSIIKSIRLYIQHHVYVKQILLAAC